ncbi:MAG TPA: glycosyltransferase family 4 protein [Rudaea sp.]
MRLAFIDLGDLDYTAHTPLLQPLGGTESALCYLCAELAQMGHTITVLNRTSAPGEYDGVSYVHRDTPGALSRANDHDAAIVIGVADGLALRAAGVRVPLIFWTGHLAGVDRVQALARPEELAVWTAFVFVSDWQRERFVQRFGIDPAMTTVLRNAIAPAFAAQPVRPAWFETGAEPTLVYTSTPFRGLVVLLHAFESIRSAVRAARLRIYSGMATYQSAQDATFAKIYARAREIAGADYVGPVAQPALAEEISTAAALAYPSIYPETSCIAAMEAMSAGAAVLTTRLGALPETVGEFGTFVDPGNDARELVARYADSVVATLRTMESDPKSAAQRRAAQIRHVREHCVWPVRAREWTQWLAQVARGGPDRA